jgi:hypothetical protein
LKTIEFPSLYRVEQHFDQTSVVDVAAEVRQRFAAFQPGVCVTPGQRVAVCVASRGTHDLVTLVKTTIECLMKMGLDPFIIPAMGSHGGGSGQGQRMVLKGLGITEATMGAPISATREAVSLGRLDSGAEIFFARDALSADHLMVINRVKPHTAFRGEVESGLCKMLAVGCGRQRGALNMHKYDLGRTIVPAAELILAKIPVLAGLAVTETALGGTHSIRLAHPDEFVKTDRELLEEAWDLLPRLPTDDLDILIVEEMGKNISGAGMDPNVIGFWRREGGERWPDYRCLVLLDLTAASHGNAHGIGMADLITRRVWNMVDPKATYLNALTSGVLRAGRLPVPMNDDRQALEQALNMLPRALDARMARIRNTSNLKTFWVSRALLPELTAKSSLTVVNSPLGLVFDEFGRLLPADPLPLSHEGHSGLS